MRRRLAPPDALPVSSTEPTRPHDARSPALTPSPGAHDPGTRLTVPALGIAQILAWGSSYYLLAILGGPIAADTGWPPEAVAGGLSTALVASAIAAPRIGALIAARGGRPVLAAGAILLAAGLASVGLAPALPLYLAGWAIIGAGMACSLYEAAFSTLSGLHGRNARRAITTLTLWGGLASTFCWPLSGWLEAQLGWRGTCLAYAAIHLAVTLPLVRLALPHAPPLPLPDAPEGPTPTRIARDPRFWLIAAAGTTFALAFAILAVHLVAILGALGHGAAAAIALGALIGPAQVGARLLEFAGGGRHHPIVTMLGATTLVAAGLAALTLGGPAGAALVAFGAGSGLWSIARGSLPLAIWGPGRHAEALGRIARPVLLASAAAPPLGAALATRLGPEALLSALTALATIPLAATLLLLLRLRRDPR